MTALVLAVVAAALLGAFHRLAAHLLTTAALAVVSVGHGPHSRPISVPHPLRQRHHGRRRAHTQPRHAREAAAA